MNFLFLFKLVIEGFHVFLLQAYAETTLSTDKFVRPLVLCLMHVLSFLGNRRASLTGFNGCKLFSLTLSASHPDLHTFSMYLGLAGLFDYSWVC